MAELGGFIAGSIVAKLLLDKTGWDRAVNDITKDKGSVLSVTKGIGEGFVQIGKMAAIAGVAAAGALAFMVKKTAEAGDQVYELAQKTGISVELLSSYKLAAEKAGSSLEGLAIGVRFLSRNMYDASRGVTAVKQNFQELGISTAGWSDQLPPINDMLLKIADRFAGMADGTEKSALAIKLLGRSGTELIPFLNLGSEGLKEEAALAEKLGIVFTAKTAAAAHELSHTLIDLHGAFDGIRNTIANAIIPVVNEFGRAVIDALAFVRGKIAEFAATGQLKDWAIGTAQVFIGAFKLMVRAVEGLMLLIPTIKAGIGTGLAWTQDVIAGIADKLSKIGPDEGLSGKWKAAFKGMAEGARGASEALKKGADENIEKASDVAQGFDVILEALDLLKVGFGKAGEEGVKAGAKIAAAFGPDLTLKNKLNIVFTSDVAEKIADITKALKLYKEQLTPEAERKLRDELQVLGEKFNFLKESMGVTFRSDVKKKIDDVALAIKLFQDRMTPESARALSEQLEHLSDDTDYLRTELGLTFSSDVTKRIDDIRLALVKYKDKLTPEAERKLRDELKALTDQFAFLKTELGITFTTDIRQRIDDIKNALVLFGDKMPIDEVIRLRKELRDLENQLSKPAWTAKWAAAINDAVAMITPILQGFDAIFAQGQKNREIAIDNEYKERLDVINKTITNEDAKQKAITALEAEYQIKRSSAAAAAAKQQKAIAFMQAVVNTASGVARAFADYMWPFSMIVAGIVAALGAVQIAMIAKQPIPLAEGAAFKKPTLVQNALVGEAGPEYLLPEKKLQTIVKEAVGDIIIKATAPAPVQIRVETPEVGRPLVETVRETFGPIVKSLTERSEVSDRRTIIETVREAILPIVQTRSVVEKTTILERIGPAMESVSRAAISIVKVFQQVQISAGVPTTALAEGAAFKTPTLLNKVLIGERGPEYVLPETKLIHIVQEALVGPRLTGAPAMAMAGLGGGGGGTVTLNLNGPLIATTGVSRRDLQAASEQFVSMVNSQLRRVGRRL